MTADVKTISRSQWPFLEWNIVDRDVDVIIGRPKDQLTSTIFEIA